MIIKQIILLSSLFLLHTKVIQNKLKEELNVIETIFNGQKTTAHLFVRNGEVMSIDMFPGFSNRIWPATVNIIKLIGEHL